MANPAVATVIIILIITHNNDKGMYRIPRSECWRETASSQTGEDLVFTQRKRDKEEERGGREGERAERKKREEREEKRGIQEMTRKLMRMREREDPTRMTVTSSRHSLAVYDESGHDNPHRDSNNLHINNNSLPFLLSFSSFFFTLFLCFFLFHFFFRLLFFFHTSISVLRLKSKGLGTLFENRRRE